MSQLNQLEIYDGFPSCFCLGSGIKLTYQKNINELDDTNVNTESEVLNIGINVSELVLTPNSK